MRLEEATVSAHEPAGSVYRRLEFTAPAIAPAVQPGQFIHLRIPGRADLVLRRPFSVFQVAGPRLAILYKIVGAGTRALAALIPGATASLLGPLGRGFPAPAPDRVPVLAAGGYGVAALYLLAQRAPRPGLAFVGAATAADLLAVADLQALGWDVRTATMDGSAGVTGPVTVALDAWLAGAGRTPALQFFACGPHGLLRAVADRARAGGWPAWVSMDRRMGCGVGVCLACVQKTRTPGGDTPWRRACCDGPVFAAADIAWDEEPA